MLFPLGEPLQLVSLISGSYVIYEYVRNISARSSEGSADVPQLDINTPAGNTRIEINGRAHISRLDDVWTMNPPADGTRNGAAVLK